jgi:short-subunit dehydrogenase
MKKAIIIGATSGIGKELALILAENGYRVGLTGRRALLLQELKTRNPVAFETMEMDITEPGPEQKLQALQSTLGGLDLLVISSGIGEPNPELDFSLEQKTISTNVTGFTCIADWAFSYFQQQGSGHIAGITSVAGLRGNRKAPSYGATKAYQINYLEGLRQKAVKLRAAITITDIRPGFVDTDMAKGEGKFWGGSGCKSRTTDLFSH